jgi:hypothetical protein
MTEPRSVNKPSKTVARPLGHFAGKTIAGVFARQGFASTELVTRWIDVVGPEIGHHCEPIKLQWPRGSDSDAPEPAILVLRVEGPVAIEIQHLKTVICERVNRFLGWRAIGDIALRQAPLTRRERKQEAPAIDPEATARVAATLTDVEDDDLRQALARLGASIKRP